MPQGEIPGAYFASARLAAAGLQWERLASRIRIPFGWHCFGMGTKPGRAECSAPRSHCRGRAAETRGTSSELGLTQPAGFHLRPMRGAEARRARPRGLRSAAVVPGSVEGAVCLQPAKPPGSAGCPSPRKDPKAPACLHVAPARRSPARRCQVAPCTQPGRSHAMPAIRGCSKGTRLPTRPGGHREALEAHRLQLSLT